MGYGVAALGMMADIVKSLKPGGAVLELGQQNIEPEVPRAEVRHFLKKIGTDNACAEKIICERFAGEPRWPVWDLFRDGRYRYRCLDLYPGEFTIVANLNSYSVPADIVGTFDLITNFGTTEHVTDQVNAFRVIHEFAKPGALLVHAVPFTGYFNHGLYNYHPLFFIFLATANEYEILSFSLSGPDLRYTIPTLAGVTGCENWRDAIIGSGDIVCMLRKVHDRPFRLFTDYDQAVMGKLKLPAPWDEMLRKRHDLKVRNAAVDPARAATNCGIPGWISSLVPGDLIRQSGHDGAVAVVTGNYGDRVTAAMTFDVVEPSEWELVSRAQHGKPAAMGKRYLTEARPDDID